MSLSEEAQQLSPDAIVHLYEIDATSLGSDIFQFCSTALADGPVMFAGNLFYPHPVEVDGFEWNGQGAAPRPTLRISNAKRFLSALTIAADGGVGAQFKRVRTFRRFLDDGSSPDTTQVFAVDFFRIERLASRTPKKIVLELAPATDQEGVMLPLDAALRNFCPLRYRRWDAVANAFDYTDATCPWIGAVGRGDGGPFFDRTGAAVTDPAQDACSKQLGSGCRKRFADQQAQGSPVNVLPFGGYPGMGQVR